ncbi:MAG: parvulin peptidyl-prolyl isomerase [Planctomycetaceae bacterium]|nr:parvulin peptidyl-prolyl isomerase [Planctomycetaceae bacterium]
MLNTRLLLVAHLVLSALCFGCTSQNVQDAVPPQAQQAGQTGSVGAKHILVMYQGSERAPARVTRTKDEAKALIEEIQEKIKKGGKFEDLAMEYSDCSTAAKGGDLGRFGRNDMTPAFEKAAFACQVGGTTDIVETPFGYHIIYRYE